jgi:hypothetical protein
MDFTPDELSRFRTAQVGHMMDVYIPQVYTYTYEDSFGEPVVTYVDGTAAICGLDMRPGTERHNPDNTILEYDAIVRLPITTIPNARDRIKITKRFGETLATALVFEIVGPIQRGPSGIRLLLKKVAT